VIFACFACIILAGLVIALFTRLAKADTELRKLKDKRPVCGCLHHLSYHDKKTSQCNGYEPGVVQAGTKLKVQCRCRQYVGPEPLANIYAPEITGN
jgi:hypothetical protein